MACNCGKRGTTLNRSPRTVSEQVDPTRALFASTRPTYLVLAHGATSGGKRFSTLAAAQDYARRTRGVIRTL